MRLTYIYHSGFAIETSKFTAIIDYCSDSISKDSGVVNDRLLYRTLKMYVLVSHSHSDHFDPVIFEWKERRNDITYILSSDVEPFVPEKYKKDVVFVRKDDVFNDSLLKVNIFGSTDLGVSFKLSFENMIMFHAGDLNNWHWNEESTPKEVAEAESFYLSELDHIAMSTSHLDLAMFPVDPRLGHDYMRGAEQFMAKIKTRVFVPMHFDSEYRKAEAIKKVAEQYGTKVYVPRHRGETLDNLEEFIDNGQDHE